MTYKEQKFLDNIEIVKKMISENKPKCEISKFLQIKQETLTNYLKKYNMDYDGNQNRKGFPHPEARIPLEKILNNETVYHSVSLKKRLIECGLKTDKCEICGISEWYGKKLVLELHHIDGNHNNNNLDNLMLLCPNCHSLTDGFRKSNK